MTAGGAAMFCSGCGTVVALDDMAPFRCVHADDGDDVDHVLARVLPVDVWPHSTESQSHLRFAELSYTYHWARAHGMSAADFAVVVHQLDEAIVAIGGCGFRETPFARRADGSGVWVKDETVNVAGSHKARHVMAIMVFLTVRSRLFPRVPTGRLAVASCGNAAVAAAVVARAAGQPLDVFVPPDADAVVRQRLTELGAQVSVCPRAAATVGDPCYLAFRRALREGAVPFGVQGNDNALTIEGGRTLGYEMVAQARAAAVTLDAVFLQVGGGALASAVIGAFEDAHVLGAIPRLPRFYAVQAAAVSPLARACDAVIARTHGGETLEQALRYAATHRSEFMWPWSGTPRSVARGIVDDETYDWRAVVAGVLRSGGAVLTVDEDALRAAAELTGADATASAGLAGLLASDVVTAGEEAAVVLTGRAR